VLAGGNLTKINPLAGNVAGPTHRSTYTPRIHIIEPNGPRSAACRGEVMNSDQMKGAAQKTGGRQGEGRIWQNDWKSRDPGEREVRPSQGASPRERR
jgi:hypothetical protein